MKDKKKLLQKIISGSRNIRFKEAVRLAEAFGFRMDRISGSHIFLFTLRSRSC
jgi:predicted RNA binding protein YcfA (HicA-like mRNA interferase family)